MSFHNLCIINKLVKYATVLWVAFFHWLFKVLWLYNCMRFGNSVIAPRIKLPYKKNKTCRFPVVWYDGCFYKIVEHLHMPISHHKKHFPFNFLSIMFSTIFNLWFFKPSYFFLFFLAIWKIFIFTSIIQILMSNLASFLRKYCITKFTFDFLNF